MLRSVVTLLVLVAAPLAAQRPRGTATPDLSGIDAIVTAAMTEWKVPGTAIGVIKDGKVILAKGYGYRDLEQKLPVTPRTLFAIGSNSKSFTAVIMGMLVDEGKLAWDTPVRTYLPDFQLHDDYATRKMTPRDLVTHRSGLPRHDALWYGRKFTRKEIYDRIRFMEPNHSFREVWQYQNLMFLTAGYLSERITGKAWETLVRERIFEPLGMTRSNTSVTESPRSDDFSWPYGLAGDTIKRIPFRNIDAVGPAGSINSSIEDMLKYVDWRIRKGEWNGKRLLSAAAEAELQTGHMVVGPAAGVIWSGFDLVAYGLGLAVGSYRGHRTVIHGGGIDGFISQMSWLPEEKIGVVVLTNQGNPVPMIAVRAIYDRLLGLPPIDWIADQRKLDQEGKAAAEKAKAALAAARKPGTRPTLPLEAYAGSYDHPGYGRVVVRLAGNGLELALDDVVTPLKHYHYDQFEGGEGAGGLIGFRLGNDGTVATVEIPLEPSVKPIVFSRAR